jgi:head-tail adaptor
MWFNPETSPVTFFQRQLVSDPTGGTMKGEYAEFVTRQANIRTVTGTEIAEAGQARDSINCIIRVRDTPVTRKITAADRAKLLEQDYEIITVGLPDRVQGFIEMTLRRQLGAP